MGVHKKKGEGFSFSHDLEFEESLLECLKQSMDQEISEEEILFISAAHGQESLSTCSLWQNTCAESDMSCINCTNTACQERKE